MTMQPYISFHPPNRKVNRFHEFAFTFTITQLKILCKDILRDFLEQVYPRVLRTVVQLKFCKYPAIYAACKRLTSWVKCT